MSKCPYDTKINACVYLEEMTEDDRKYECPTCPHYKPQSYYDQPERESSAMAAIIVVLVVFGIFVVGYLAYKLVNLVVSWVS